MVPLEIPQRMKRARLRRAEPHLRLYLTSHLYHGTYNYSSVTQRVTDMATSVPQVPIDAIKSSPLWLPPATAIRPDFCTGSQLANAQFE